MRYRVACVACWKAPTVYRFLMEDTFYSLLVVEFTTC